MKLVIVEDSDLIRTQLVRIVGLQPRIQIVGVCGEEESAVALILEQQPDAVLLDLSLSPGSGLSVLKRIRLAQSACKVLVLSNNTDDAIRQECESIGISGFYDKTEDAEACLQQLFSWLPPVPGNEAARMQSLRETRLLDSPADETFDNIARLARDITDAPIALVSLMDQGRHWLLARQGLAADEVTQSIAFCTHAMTLSDVMEVTDARQDARFQHNTLVTGSPSARFCAGVPLVLASGESLGALCILDTVVRTLTESQRSALKTLAHSVVSEIELRRKMLRLEQEVSRRRSTELQMTELAMHDPLTKLPNRAALLDRLDQQVRRATRDGSVLAFLFMDLDRFKGINDTLGHDVGDDVLVEVATRIRGELRDSDTVARLGGDEFAVLLPDVGSIDIAQHIAEKINLALHLPTLIRGYHMQFSASIGIAVYPGLGENVEELMRNADLAMYQAKQSGGHCASVFTPALNARAWDLLSLEVDFRNALAGDQIIAVYQPQVVLGTTDLCGVEALARWQHPQQGLLGPDRFVEFAEKRGFICELGARMLDLALGQIVKWDAEGLAVPRVAVNVSAMELRDGYVATVDAALAKHGVSPHRLELEITESTLTANRTAAFAVLQALRDRGVTIAVDDFGVGYSSLGQLRRLPIDVLKIDKCFVDEVTTDPRDAAIVSAVVTMARSLGLHTLAEGAEALEQLVTLQALGCECVQGYVLAKPMPAEQLGFWVRDTSLQRALSQL